MSQITYVSIITPCRNETSTTLLLCHTKVHEVMQSLDVSYQHLFVDNGSKDEETPCVLARIAAADPCVCVLFNGRDYGPDLSIMNAALYTTGDAVLLCLAADLQDDPTAIPLMIDRWRTGARIVRGVRTERTKVEPAWKVGLRGLCYRLMSLVLDHTVPAHVGMFQLVDRTIVDKLNALRGAHLSLRVVLATMDVPTASVYVPWRPRTEGKSKTGWVGAITELLLGLHTAVYLRFGWNFPRKGRNCPRGVKFIGITG